MHLIIDTNTQDETILGELVACHANKLAAQDIARTYNTYNTDTLARHIVWRTVDTSTWAFDLGERLHWCDPRIDVLPSERSMEDGLWPDQW